MYLLQIQFDLSHRTLTCFTVGTVSFFLGILDQVGFLYSVGVHSGSVPPSGLPVSAVFSLPSFILVSGI